MDENIMIGQELKKLRELKNLSQQKLADNTGVKKLTIIQIEKNRVDPKLSTVVKLLNKLLPVYPNGRKNYSILHKLFK